MGVENEKIVRTVRWVIRLKGSHPDPFRCKNCSFVFDEPHVYLDRGNKIMVCPFCSSREIEKT